MELGSDTIAGLDKHLDELQEKAEQRLLDQVALLPLFGWKHGQSVSGALSMYLCLLPSAASHGLLLLSDTPPC